MNGSMGEALEILNEILKLVQDDRVLSVQDDRGDCFAPKGLAMT
ncbi:MAG: hypothetical protein ABH810_00795 [bacterium]